MSVSQVHVIASLDQLQEGTGVGVEHLDAVADDDVVSVQPVAETRRRRRQIRPEDLWRAQTVHTLLEQTAA